MQSFWFSRCATAIAVLALFGLQCSEQASAQQYPNRRITFIVGFAPGGIADTLARLIAHGLEPRLGQSVVVENHAGAGGNIAAAIVARAPADGYTLLLTTTALAINLTLHKHNAFTQNDFKTVAITASSPEAIVANPKNPANDLAELVKAAKGKTINFGSAGVGSGSHIEAAYFFKKIAKVSAVHIPYQGGAPAVNAVISNQIEVMAGTLGGAVAAQINAGKLKGLGIAAAKRAAVTPNVPTYAEQGFPDYQAASWVGIFAPAKTDPATIGKLNAAVEQVIKNPAVQNELQTIGFEPIHETPAQADAYFKSEVTKWGRMVKELGLSIN